ncbi:MAG TPA: GntR family transcriptional regulator [Propionibacteriaceae bacterium]|nr:GntR family transcriptional regulator [Propionibacteriaceae bacterium]
MVAQPLTNLDRSTLRERSLEALHTAITSGEYRPGDHLGEEELAGRLGVSRGTVREALRHLQQEGLVTAGARGMLRVNSLSPAEIRDLFQVRGALEGLAVTLIIASPSRDAAVARLHTALSDLDDRGHDFSAHIDADLRFHLLLCELSENSVLVDAWRHLEGRVRITILSDSEDHHSHLMSGSHHAPIVDAIEAGDSAQAVKVLHDHMMFAADRLAGPAGSR